MAGGGDRRPPRGGRGLKSYRSLSNKRDTRRRPPRGGRGLKFRSVSSWRGSVRRPPRGGRGLKLKNALAEESAAVVAPLAGGVD